MHSDIVSVDQELTDLIAISCVEDDLSFGFNRCTKRHVSLDVG
jgi:hypothetical protein